jgi:hypothetical protein
MSRYDNEGKRYRPLLQKARNCSVSQQTCCARAQTLNAICSRKCATPFVSADSYRDPVSIQSPMVSVSCLRAQGTSSSWSRKKTSPG